MIDLLPNAEQQQIADSVRGLLADSDFARAAAQDRNYARQRASSTLWADLAALGCFGLSTDEADGGAGLTIVEEILVFRECGRFLVSPAVLSTVLAARLASLGGRNELLTDLIGGKQRAAVMSPQRGAIVDRECTGDFQLIDAEPGDLAVVWGDRGAGLIEVPAGHAREELHCIDPTIKLFRIKVDRMSPLTWIAAEKEPLWQRAMVYLGAMFTGMIEECRDVSVSYAKIREQFGHPIGVFQAVKHSCADMALWAEAAWSQTVWATLRLLADGGDGAFQASNAAMIGAEAALTSARKALQIHGGMGFTAEISVHLFLKRAHVFCQLIGEVHSLQQRLTEMHIDT